MSRTPCDLGAFVCRLLLALLLATGGAAAAPLDPLLTEGNLWTMTPDEFATATKGMGFQWVSSAKDSARAAVPSMSLYGLPVVEAVAHFPGGKLADLTLAIYARGDAGNIDKEAYSSLIKAAVETLNRATGVKFSPRGKDAGSVVRADGVFWANPKAHYLLEYSATREVKTRDIPFRAEFVRLEITAPPKQAGLLATATSLSSPRFKGADHVKRDAASGDVVIPDVPMVDQGQKGYCVVASTERVMRYYGVPVDANELAQIANSDASGGTSYEGMFRALKRVSARLKVRVRQLEETKVSDLLELVKDYNRSAKKADAQVISTQGHILDVGAIYHTMKPDLLREVRTHNKASVSRFQREIQQHIDEGVPLLWAVQLGLVPEPGIPQDAGGHMRLIIGYNLERQELLFSDSWGAGHELKRLPLNDAWTMTTGLAAIEPLN